MNIGKFVFLQQTFRKDKSLNYKRNVGDICHTRERSNPTID